MSSRESGTDCVAVPSIDKHGNPDQSDGFKQMLDGDGQVKPEFSPVAETASTKPAPETTSKPRPKRGS